MIKHFRNKWHGDLQVENNRIESLCCSIFSFSQNEYLKSNKYDFSVNEEYQFVKKLHSLLKVYSVGKELHLSRKGKKNDGGYTMVEPFSERKIAYSIGISKDISWDWDIAENHYLVYQYDHTIKRLPQKRKEFHWKRLGLSNQDGSRMRRLLTMLKENGHDKENGMLLKIDIEGNEWEVLNSLCDNELDRFDQILIEVHNMMDIEKRELILNGINRLLEHHALVHIHANNYAPVFYYGDMVMPNTLELTLVHKSKYSLFEEKKSYPIEIDMPCDEKIPDIQLGIWN